MTSTRPNICHAVRLVSRFQFNPVGPKCLLGWVQEVTCSLPHGKSHDEDSSSKPFMSEWEVDVVFEFMEWTIKE
ncbi:hypothetical protein CsSME_00050387 [Camellia sinensis var. sinensis]